MFDANMRYLPKGLKFFAKAHGVSDSINRMGVNIGDLILCRMLNKGNDNPIVDMLINGKLFSVSSDKDFYDNLFVYEGCFDGSGFIDKHSKNKAMNILNNTWG